MILLRASVIFLFAFLYCVNATNAVEIPMENRGGVYTLPVKINSVITLNFILDSGAAEVNIPADVALTLIRTGTIKEEDFLPGETYTLADGSKTKSPRFNIQKIEIGGQIIQNVSASIGSVNSSLLLGQSLLSRLQSWSIDNALHSFVFFGVLTGKEFIESTVFQDEINSMLCAKVTDQNVRLPRILGVHKVNSIYAVHIHPPHREFSNVILFKSDNHQISRIFEAFTIGITPEPSSFLDLHTIGFGIDMTGEPLVTKSKNDRIVFNEACKHMIRHYLIKNGMVAIPYTYFIHAHPSNGRGSDYTIDKTMFYDLVRKLFGAAWEKDFKNDCMMYDLPVIDHIIFRYDNQYCIKAETSNEQLWTISFDDVDDDNMYLINKKVTVMKK